MLWNMQALHQRIFCFKQVFFIIFFFQFEEYWCFIYSLMQVQPIIFSFKRNIETKYGLGKNFLIMLFNSIDKYLRWNKFKIYFDFVETPVRSFINCFCTAFLLTTLAATIQKFIWIYHQMIFIEFKLFIVYTLMS